MEVIAVVGLGYVGLPMSGALGRLLPTIGYDLSLQKREQYRQHIDPSSTVIGFDMRAAARLSLTGNQVDQFKLLAPITAFHP